MAENRYGEEGHLPKLYRNSEKAERKEEAEARGININDLPPEIMVIIFSSFSFNDLIDTVQNVCVRWRRLAHNPALWLDKEYIIRPRRCKLQGRSCCGEYFTKCVHCRCDTTNEEVLRTAGTMPQLRTLTLMRGVGAHILRKICANCPNLTNLQIAVNQEMDSSLLKYVFDKCPKIKKLRIRKSLLADRRCAELLSSLQHLSSLEVFEDSLRSGFALLPVLADGCPQLQEINFKGFYWMDDINYFFEAKKHNLTSVTVPWTVGSPGWIGKTCVVPLLKQCCPSLRRLQLTNFDVPPGQLAAAFRALGQLHSLHELTLQDVGPPTPQMVSLAFRPGCLTELRRLHLIRVCGLQEESLITISRGCPNLCELRIDSAPITDIALSEIHHLKHLEILELSGCRSLCDAAMTHVAQLPALHTLILKKYRRVSNLLEILDRKQLRWLDKLGCRNIEGVPFRESPRRLINLRELHVQYNYNDGDTVHKYKDENELSYKLTFTALRFRMPHLKIINTFPITEDDFIIDEEGDGVSNDHCYGVGDNDD